MKCKYCDILLGPAETKRGLDLCVRCEMTRDEFAAAALTALLRAGGMSPPAITGDSFVYADAMMEARKK